ncbi:cation:proton antiporter [Candidatus Daviesbacteria bacterium]|nr:cation:proton antiporter [Candidatus Daviesbacteria bacterium]
MREIFFQLAIVLSLSSLIGLVVLRLRLPLVVAYLLAGVSLSLVRLFDPHSSLIFEVLPEIGIAFVLFLIGMELDLREIRALGKPIILAAIGQIIISTLAGFFIASLLGFQNTESIYLGLGLAFSSTIVVIKLLLEKRDLTSLYGKLSLGILLIEDLVAIAALMMISVSHYAFNLGFQQSLPLLSLIAKAIGLFVLTFILSKYVLEKIFDRVARSVELLFLTAITWCFIFTSLAVTLGFSVVIGAFLAGVALASSPYHLQIQGKVKPLRDFFLTLFFVYLGSQASVEDALTLWPAILVFTIYALVAKPIIYLAILALFGFRKHTLFQTSLNLSQISEFSLVVLLVGVKEGLASPQALSVMAAVGVISIVASSILISYSKQIYKVIVPFIQFFERKDITHSLETKIEEELIDHTIVIGADRIGGPVVDFLQREKIPFIVMDFNPHIVEQLRERGVKVLYGDAGDPEILDNLQMENAKLIISTATDMADNEMLVEECRRRKIKAKIVVRALDNDHSQALKALGADYVILPEKVSAEFLVDQIRTHWLK